MTDKKVIDLTDPKYWKEILDPLRNIPYRPPFQHPGDHKPKGEPWKPGPHPPQKE